MSNLIHLSFSQSLLILNFSKKDKPPLLCCVMSPKQTQKSILLVNPPTNKVDLILGIFHDM